MSGREPSGRPETAADLRNVRRTRRHPRPTQFDYLHLRCLLEDLTGALDEHSPAARNVLDLYCGTRPYEDLLPADAEVIGLDIADRYGLADVVTDEVLPFPDDSFDLVLCTQAFQYLPNPEEAVRELARVVRPGGSVVVSIVLVWEYDRRILERRYTGPELEHLFSEWPEVRVDENGGMAVSWATLTGRLLSRVESQVARGRVARPLAHAAFAIAYLLVNGLGAALHAVERHRGGGPFALPMNLLLTARRTPHE